MPISETVCFRGFSVDPKRACLRSPTGEEIRLRPQSFAMLLLFVSNAGRVLSKHELFEAIWPDVHVGEDSLFQCVREIRAALDDDHRQLIKLVSGRGYMFQAEVSVAADPGGEAARDGGSPAAAPRPPEPAPPRAPWSALKLRGWRARGAFGALVAALALAAVALFGPEGLFAPRAPLVAVMPIFAAADDLQAAQAATGLTKRLADGLSAIANIRVVAPGLGEAGGLTAADRALRARANFVVTGDIQRNAGAWEARARMIEAASGELLWEMTYSVDVAGAETGLLQDRATSAFGYALALRVNKLINSDPRSGRLASSDNGEVVIEQANAFIEHTTPERFQSAEAVLEKALAADPTNVDLQLALASHRLRGIQTVWYPEATRAEKRASAEAMLVAALKAKPTYIPALEGYCRFLTATNRFVDGQVACARTLAYNPWDGTALYEMGLGQFQLGRFEEALATFKRADRFDTPRVSRWTWSLGAGLSCLFLDRDEEAIGWLEKSIAITPGSGRSYFALAAAYQKAGKAEEAKLTLAKGLKFKPDATLQTFALPSANASPVFIEARSRLFQVLLDLGLPES